MAHSDSVQLGLRIVNTLIAKAYYIHYHCAKGLVKSLSLSAFSLDSEILAPWRTIAVLTLAFKK